MDVFYEHEGRYQRERAGLYKTRYDPRQLAAAMNAEEKGNGALGNDANTPFTRSSKRRAGSST